MDTIVPAPTTPMPPAELRAFLNERAKEQDADRESIRRARYLSAAIRRAESLLDDGYTVKAFTLNGTGNDFPGLFTVTKPQSVNELGFTEYTGCYAVKCSPDFHHCTCPAWAEWGECKHHLCVARELEQEAATETDGERWDACREFYADAAETYYHRAA